MKKFDYQGALNEGYSDDEIFEFLRENKPDFDYEGALENGYSPQEINEFISSYKPERSTLEKAGRVGAQFGTALLEAEMLPYDLAVAPLASEEAQISSYRQNLSEDLERLQEQKAMGIWDEQDQELYDSIVNQIKNPEASRQFVQTADLSSRGLLEKATGLDLEPEGFLEHAAQFTGYVKNPNKLAKGLTGTISPKNLIKNIVPSFNELSRGAGAAAAFQAAQAGNLGPIGTLAAIVVGDVVGGGLQKAISQPKKTIANALAAFTKKDAVNLQKEIIRDAKAAGIQLDAGTMTDSNLIKMIQTRLAQSGLVGKDLRELKNQIEKDVIKNYNELANSLGELKYATVDEAGAALKEGLNDVRDIDLQKARDFYTNAENLVGENAFVDTSDLNKAVEKLYKKLTPGQVKGSEQKAVLSTLDALSRDIKDSAGNPLMGDIKSLINNKIAINDIINYEVQGGAKKLLGIVLDEIDEAILSYGKENPRFAKNYALANKKFSEHAKTFRSKEMSAILRNERPETLLKKMDSISGIQRLEKAFNNTPEGKRIFRELKRYKVQELIGDKLINSESNQIKTGTFSNFLNQNKDTALFKELLGNEAYKDFKNLVKNVSRVNDTLTRFYNASQSGTVAVDAAAIMTGVSAIGQLFMGNPWPIAKFSAVLGGAKGAAKLLSDPEFLKILSEAIESRGGVSPQDTARMLQQLSRYFLSSNDVENRET